MSEEVVEPTQNHEVELAEVADEAATVEFTDGQSVTEDEEEDSLGAPSLSAALEALLLVADEPIDTATLANLTRTPIDDVLRTLHDLAQEYAVSGRGFDLRELGGGWRYWTRDNCAGVVERFVLDGQHARLTQASLETLAVVAYRQPVTRARISAIRGVNVDGVVRTLVTRGLIEEQGHDQQSGAILYGTTSFFLERLGLRELSELPPIAEHLPMPDSVEEVLESVTSV
jgi:segregation and condensation protein B